MAELADDFAVIAGQLHRKLRVFMNHGFQRPSVKGHHPSVRHAFYRHQGRLLRRKMVQAEYRVLLQKGHNPVVSFAVVHIHFHPAAAQIVHPAPCFMAFAQLHALGHLHRRRAVPLEHFFVLAKFPGKEIANAGIVPLVFHAAPPPVSPYSRTVHMKL